MIDTLIPWKKKNRDLNVQRDGNPIAQLRNEFDGLWNRWLDEIGGGLTDWSGSGGLSSRMSLDDDEKQYVLRAELPGFEPEEFDVKVSGNVLTLQAEHKEEGKEKNGSYAQYGSFYESFTLPQGIQEDQIDARYHSGVLELHLPKSQECQAKRIAVKSA
ncbi:Spore protein SP21 [Novipirellula aureliae]|uniref:Spore protein SP21 n=1 Tax=Novipirellula aureliae TaxID=2527966 RepID=A0A5C6E3U9_9BACT|nr:Hsp20/alpha crystallin family protein [Novipirellula aureliae]TWU43500.1 Spore protein SP21 [Novipirellula aureliae]